MSSFAESIAPTINSRSARGRFVRSAAHTGGSGAIRATGFRSDDNFRFGQPDELGAGLWTHGLLDRLQEPISRYHE